MSVNKNIKNGDFREIFTYRDENDDNKPKLLKDLVNTDASIKNKVSIDPSNETEPYRLWTADHFSKDFPNSSMYGIAPII